MTTAEMLLRAKADLDEVYSAGFEAGKAEGGTDSYYDTLWDSLQNYGNRTNLNNAFNGWGNGGVIRPKYSIRPTQAEYMFSNVGNGGDLVEQFNDCDITLDFSNCQRMNYCFSGSTFTRLGIIDLSVATGRTAQVFGGMSNLITIDKVVVVANNALTSTFQNATALQNVTFEGEIGQNVNFQWSPLSVASMKSVIDCLKSYAGTDNEFTYSVKFTEECWAALEADSTAPDGGTWQDYVTSLGYNT